MAPATTLFAPVSGTVGEIKVAEGQVVQAGEIVIIQHESKTESNVSAPTSGRIKLLVQKGASVSQGDRLAEIQP